MRRTKKRSKTKSGSPKVVSGAEKYAAIGNERHVGDEVWLYSKKEWVQATIQRIEPDGAVEVRTVGQGGRSVRVKGALADERLKPRAFDNSTGSGANDMDDMPNLHEPAIVHNLVVRFDKGLIYTDIGPILIAVNPFKAVDTLYSATVMSSYRAANPLSSAAPHCWKTAEIALRALNDQRASQSIVICGESGSGKTWTTKLILRYIGKTAAPPPGVFGNSASTLPTHPALASQVAATRASFSKTPLEERIMQSNPVMEAFGNAKTHRNENSSRFGKLVKIYMSEIPGQPDRCAISSAGIVNYLLEKVRVVHRAQGERSFHIFYQLCAGAGDMPGLKAELGLQSAAHYDYLNSSGRESLQIEGMDERGEFAATRGAMSILGMSEDKQRAVFRVAAAVLHLGNVHFSPDASEVSGDGALATVDDHAPLDQAAKLLGLKGQSDHLEATLTVRAIRGPDGIINRELTHVEAESTKDALSKALFQRLFSYLMVHINKSLQGKPSRKFIGILDIYGFEFGAVNGIEQLFINYANEKLQALFNKNVFESEKVEYEREQIEWSASDFPSNKNVMNLIDKSPMGILHLVDEECMMGERASDKNLAAKLKKQHSKSRSYEFAGPGSAFHGGTIFDFNIIHFAGPVTYTVDNWVGKNKDTLLWTINKVMQLSTDPFVQSLFSDGATVLARRGSQHMINLAQSQPRGGGKKSKSKRKQEAIQTTICKRFIENMKSLIKTLSDTSTHFVRCIKSNPPQRPGLFDKSEVGAQLRYSGVMAALNMRRSGYPNRLLFVDFLKRYDLLCPSSVRSQIDNPSSDKNQLVRGLLNGSALAGAWDEDMIKVGTTKVFMRAHVMHRLDGINARRKGVLLTKVQVAYRGWIARKKYAAIHDLSVAMHAIVFGRLARRRCAAELVQARITGAEARLGELKDRLQRSADLASSQLVQTALSKAQRSLSQTNDAVRDGDIDRAKRLEGETGIAIEELEELIATALECTNVLTAAKKNAEKTIAQADRVHTSADTAASSSGVSGNARVSSALSESKRKLNDAQNTISRLPASMGATVDRILRDGVPAAKKLGAEWISKADDAHKAANAATALVSGQKEWADSVERARHAAKNMMREVHREFDGLERLAVSSGVDQDGDATRIIDTARNSVEEAGAMVEEPVTETDDVADLSAQWEHAAAQALADTRAAKHRVEDIVLAKKDADAAREKAAFRVAASERKLNHLHEVIRIENDAMAESSPGGSHAPSVTSDMAVVQSLSRAKQVLLHAQSLLESDDTKIAPTAYGVAADDVEDAVAAASDTFELARAQLRAQLKLDKTASALEGLEQEVAAQDLYAEGGESATMLERSMREAHRVVSGAQQALRSGAVETFNPACDAAASAVNEAKRALGAVGSLKAQRANEIDEAQRLLAPVIARLEAVKGRAIRAQVADSEAVATVLKKARVAVAACRVDALPRNMEPGMASAVTGTAQDVVREAEEIVVRAIETKEYREAELSRLARVAAQADADVAATREQLSSIPSLSADPSVAGELARATDCVRAALDSIPPPLEDEDEDDADGQLIHHWSMLEMDELDMDEVRDTVDRAAAAVHEMGVRLEARIAAEEREIQRLRDELPAMQRRLMASTTMADVSGLGRIPAVSRALEFAARKVDVAQNVLAPQEGAPPPTNRVNIEEIGQALSALESTIEDHRDRRRQEEAERRRRSDEQRAEQRRLIEAEHARLRMADERRKHGLAKLDPAVHRLAELTASAEVHQLHKVGSVGEALREAEIAVESAAERAINGDENVEIAAEAALLRVEVVEQILTSELQRAQREAADERACEKWKRQLSGLADELAALEALAAKEGLSSATYMCNARSALEAAESVRDAGDALLLEQRLLIAGDKVRAAHQLVDRELMHTKKKADLKERMLKEKERVEGAKETFLLAKQRLAAAWAMAEVEANAGHLFEPAAAEAALETAAVALERAETSILALPETGDAEGMVALIGVAMREVEVAEAAVEREKRRLLVWQRRSAAEERRKAAHATKVRPALLDYIKRCEDERKNSEGPALLTDGSAQEVYDMLSYKEHTRRAPPPPPPPRAAGNGRRVHVARTGSIDIAMDPVAAAKIAALVGSEHSARFSAATSSRMAGGALSSGRGYASRKVAASAAPAPRSAVSPARSPQRPPQQPQPQSRSPSASLGSQRGRVTTTRRGSDAAFARSKVELSLWSPQQIQGALTEVPRADLLREFGRADEKRLGILNAIGLQKFLALIGIATTEDCAANFIASQAVRPHKAGLTRGDIVAASRRSPDALFSGGASSIRTRSLAPAATSEGAGYGGRAAAHVNRHGSIDVRVPSGGVDGTSNVGVSGYTNSRIEGRPKWESPRAKGTARRASPRTSFSPTLRGGVRESSFHVSSSSKQTTTSLSSSSSPSRRTSPSARSSARVLSPAKKSPRAHVNRHGSVDVRVG